MLNGKKIVLIAAMDRNNAIGKSGSLPWHIPTDLKFFKENTLGETLLMGRKTYQSIGRPLPGRTTLILTRDPYYKVDGVETVLSLKGAIDRVESEKLMVAGGGDVYRQAMPYADELIITHVDIDVGGDTFFPAIGGEWQPASETNEVDKNTGISLKFSRYQQTS